MWGRLVVLRVGRRAGRALRPGRPGRSGGWVRASVAPGEGEGGYRGGRGRLGLKDGGVVEPGPVVQPRAFGGGFKGVPGLGIAGGGLAHGWLRSCVLIALT